MLRVSVGKRFSGRGSVRAPSFATRRPPKRDVARAELPQIRDELHVGGKAGGDCAEVFQPGLARGVVGGALDGVHGVHAAGDRGAHHVVDVALAEDLVGLAVIRAEGELIEIAYMTHALPDLLHVLHNGGFARVDVNAAAQLFERLRGEARLMAGVRPGAAVSGERAAREHRRVALQVQPGLLRGVEDLHHARRAADNAGEIHDLRQTHGAVKLRELADLRRPERGSAAFQSGSGGHAARHVDQLAHRQSLAALVHVPHALLAEDVRNLVRVADHGRRSLRDYRFREMARRHHRALNMLVRINKAGQQIAARGVDHRLRRSRIFPGPRGLHVDDKTAGGVNVRRVNFAREHVDKFRVPDQKLARFLPQRRAEQRLPVLRSNFSFRFLLSCCVLHVS